MKFTFKVTGLKKLEKLLDVKTRATPERLKAALYQEAEEIMADSKENYVPVDTGTLRSSGYVEPPKQTGRKITITLGFGGAAKEYAVTVHEDMNAYHKTGSAKYLERPMRAKMQGMTRRLKEKMRG